VGIEAFDLAHPCYVMLALATVANY